MELPQANSPNDLPAGRTIHMRSAFQVWTVQAERKAKLYVYRGPKTNDRPDVSSEGAPYIDKTVIVK
jgi:hypothetical protein